MVSIETGTWDNGDLGSGTWTWFGNFNVLTIEGSGALPEGVQSWGTVLGRNYAVKRISIGEGITSIGSSNFSHDYSGNSSLTQIIFRGNITSIGTAAFNKCGDASIIFLKNTTAPTIGKYAFYGSSGRIFVATKGWGSSVFTSDVLYKRNVTFYQITSQNGTWNNGDLGSGTWNFDANTNVFTLSGNGVVPTPTAGGYLECALGWNEVKVEEGITGLDQRVFATNIANNSRFYMPANKVFLPSTLTSIGDYVFQGWHWLKSIVIPDKVTSIGGYCFSECMSLTDVMFGKSLISIGDGCFRETDPYAPIYTFMCRSPPTLGYLSFQLSNSHASQNTDGVINTVGGWGSDDVFNSSVKGSYTTFTYEKLVTVNVNVNVSGTWKPSVPYVNVNGTWKEVEGVYVNVNGTWKEAV